MEISNDEFLEMDHAISCLIDNTKSMLCKFESGEKETAFIYLGKVAMLVEFLEEKWEQIDFKEKITVGDQE